MSETAWSIAPPSTAAPALAAALGLPPVLGQILANRGFTDAAGARLFLEAGLEDIPDPFLLSGMDAAVARIADSHEVAAAVSHGAAMRVWVPHRAGNVERPSTRVLANTDVILLEGSATSGWTVLSWADEVFVP